MLLTTIDWVFHTIVLGSVRFYFWVLLWLSRFLPSLNFFRVPRIFRGFYFGYLGLTGFWEWTGRQLRDETSGKAHKKRNCRRVLQGLVVFWFSEVILGSVGYCWALLSLTRSHRVLPEFRGWNERQPRDKTFVGQQRKERCRCRIFSAIEPLERFPATGCYLQTRVWHPKTSAVGRSAPLRPISENPSVGCCENSSLGIAPHDPYRAGCIFIAL